MTASLLSLTSALCMRVQDFYALTSSIVLPRPGGQAPRPLRSPRRKHSGDCVYFARSFEAAGPRTLVEREGPPREVVRDVRLVVHQLIEMHQVDGASGAQFDSDRWRCDLGGEIVLDRWRLDDWREVVLDGDRRGRPRRRFRKPIDDEAARGTAYEGEDRRQHRAGDQSLRRFPSGTLNAAAVRPPAATIRTSETILKTRAPSMVARRNSESNNATAPRTTTRTTAASTVDKP